MNEKVEHSYTAQDIQVLEGLEAVRKRPGMYIGSTSQRGLHHLVWEIVDNSIDEALAGHANQIKISIDEENIVTVEDNGRGMPVGVHSKTGKSSVETIFTVLHAGGKFGGGAYFDEMKINKVLDKSYLKDKSKILEWKRTLRAIKQELQKTENKIDFNTYRNYELAAHYEELSVKKNFKDTSILWATKWSSNFGNWFWAFWFTLIICLVFFTSYFILENLDKSFNLSNWEDFVYGYFRFFLITDFKNEYYEAGESVLKFNCFVSLFPFIIGKIAVAFGLYEMIQSFRKFKA